MRVAAVVLFILAAAAVAWTFRSPPAMFVYGHSDLLVIWDASLRGCRQVEISRKVGDGAEERRIITVLGPCQRILDPWLRVTIDESGGVLQPLGQDSVRVPQEAATVWWGENGWNFSPEPLDLDPGELESPDISAGLSRNLYQEIAERVPSMAALVARIPAPSDGKKP